MTASLDPVEPTPITILDGGMGKELRRIGAPFRQPEWSALALLESPEHVTTAHRNFIAAGADVIITNTYAVVPHHLGAERFEARGRELTELAARLARAAADEAAGDVLVAGSLPPLFGSYEPDDFAPDTAPALWRDLIEPQIPFVDLWVGETLSSTTEARVLIETLASVGGADKPRWLSFTVRDFLEGGRATLRSGEPMSAIAELLTAAAAGRPHVDAVLFNCSQPEVIGPAIVELRSLLPDVKLGAYANGFADHNAESDEYVSNEIILEGRADLTPERYADLAAQWTADGAAIVGGCCEIYPDHIAALASRFRR